MNNVLHGSLSRRHLIRGAASVGLMCALQPEMASASLVLAMELPEITATADAIVVAKVVAMHSRLEAGGKAILTETQLQVQEAWKGKLAGDARTITVLQPGGVVGDIEMRVHGLPVFRQGEEAVLFLNERIEKQPALGFVLTGLGQGKRRLFREASGRIMAAPSDRSAAVLKSQTGQWVKAAAEASVPLDDLRQQVRLLLAGAR